MVTKKSVTILLFIIAVLLVFFAVGMKIYSTSSQSTSSQIQDDGGKIELAILPQETAPSLITYTGNENE
jgi:hypothetical protein